MGAKPIRTATFLGHEEDSNPPGLGPGDTRGSTEMPDHFICQQVLKEHRWL